MVTNGPRAESDRLEEQERLVRGRQMVKGNRKDRRSKREGEKTETEKEDKRYIIEMRDRSGREDKTEIKKDKTEEWR